MTNLIAIIIFTAACSILVYTWALYPVTMLLLHRKHTATEGPQVRPAQSIWPHVSIIIAAWNEESVIADRIANLETLDYPQQCLSVFIGTDGCTDCTAERAQTRAAQSPLHVQVQAYPLNRGKASVLVDLVALAIEAHPNGDSILLFSDANTVFAHDAVTHLVARMQSPAVGAVCGRLVFVQRHDQPEHTYWSLETKLKQIEAHYDSCLGANGAIYAIRATCFWRQLPPQTIIDDFVIGMKVREAGLRIVFEPNAVAYEDIPQTSDEWKRRVRIGSGAYQALHWCRACMHPRYGRFACFFWSHKILRWFSPHLYLLAFASAILALATTPAHHPWRMAGPAGMLILSAALLALVLLHLCLPQHPASKLRRLIAGIHHFSTMQMAMLAGFVRFCRGNLTGTWHRTPRTPCKNTPT